MPVHLQQAPGRRDKGAKNNKPQIVTFSLDDSLPRELLDDSLCARDVFITANQLP
ncbi:MAG: hypothetical protein IPK32_14255 [Verrucomicrobiaceae bacterium]|nr:hypothetical protein [Verrucomicrobiaceae bacterium]